MTGRRRVDGRLVAGSLLVGSAALVVVAMLTAGGAAPDTSTTPATGAVPPTIAPISVLAPPASPPAPTPPPPPTTLALSPLAALLGEVSSAVPAPATTVPTPVGIAIDAIAVEAAVVPVGVQPDGQLEIPDQTAVGWYRLGSSPGQRGATVLAAHVNWHHRNGPFLRLRQLDPGAAVRVTLADGSVRTYQVVERQQYDKRTLPADRVWTRRGPETLVLITCGGSFDQRIRRYRDNIVVYAVPVA